MMLVAAVKVPLLVFLISFFCALGHAENASVASNRVVDGDTEPRELIVGGSKAKNKYPYFVESYPVGCGGVLIA